MSRKRLNPFEKEFLIRQSRENSDLTPNDFYNRFMNGDLEREYTFFNRFDDCPKFDE